MANQLLYGNDEYFVLLEPHQEEVILSVEELREKLRAIVPQAAESLPRDVARLPDLEAQVQRLIDTDCELELRPGERLQWYAVRLEKP